MRKLKKLLNIRTIFTEYTHESLSLTAEPRTLYLS